jgi:CRISPR-associated endonuclease Csn1
MLVNGSTANFELINICMKIMILQDGFGWTDKILRHPLYNIRRKHLRLGFDIGTNSIGWWLYDTDQGEISGVIDGGVRIFSDGRDPKSKASLAVDRRIARGQRRRRDRYLRRKAALMKRMAEAGLMPANPGAAKELEMLDPYALRAKGLDHQLPITHFGRALFHLNQRRGFKSNRKTDRGDNESGKIKDATARLDQEMMAKGARTYGEFLHMRRMTARSLDTVPPVRTRLSVARRGDGEKPEEGYDFYPDRRHLSEEFEKLWAVQAAYYPDILTDDLHDEISVIIFHQRPLKSPDVGFCLFTDEKRLPNAHPLNQRRILVETVNALRIATRGDVARPLNRQERDQILHALDNKKHTKTLSGMALKLKFLGKQIKLRADQSFTLETANRDSIACDPVRASLSDPRRFGAGWSALDYDAQWHVIERILAVQSDADHHALVDWLMSQHQLGREAAEETAYAPLPEGYGRLGLTASARILDALMEDVIPYSAAVAKCGWHHSDERTGEVLENLPYYGKILTRHVIPGSYDERDDDITRYGRITNPTVHIGLNQLRRLVNRIITVYGKPDEIVVELARDLKLSLDQKRDVEKTIRKNTEDAKKRGQKLVSELGQKDTGANRMLLRLWEDLNPDDCLKRFCPYSGQKISAAMLFDGSCDVDHILPYSRTLDDSFANRTLCLKEFNRQKSNKTPWEAWGNTDQWPKIEATLKYLPKNKLWRFAPDAMERFEGENDFTARALKDTQYLSRIARAYLSALYDGGDGKSHVWVVPGRLTEMLRRHWGLNSLLPDHNGATKAKNRTDHRHHAIDAAVVAATDRSLIKRIGDMARHDELSGAEDIARSVPPPWDTFRDDMQTQLARITVSHRADHGRMDGPAVQSGRDNTVGALHEATALGIVDDNTVAVRISVDALKPGHLVEHSNTGYIRDPYLRDQLAHATRDADAKTFADAVHAFFARSRRYRGTRHIRILKTLKATSRIAVPKHAPIKAYKSGSNHAFEIWHMPDGTYKPQVITAWELHNLDTLKRPHPAAKRVLRLHKNDMVAIERDGQTVICHVQKTGLAHGAYLVPHNEANADARNRNASDPFRWFQMSAGSLIKARARRVWVDEMGRLRDPGARQK